MSEPRPFTAGDRVVLNDVGKARMSPGSTNPDVGFVVGFSLSEWFVIVEGRGKDGNRHRGSYRVDSWEKMTA